MRIILSFFKIAGIAVFVLLLLLVVLLVCFLFVPFSYHVSGCIPEAKARSLGEQINVTFRVSFLLFFFRLLLHYTPEEPTCRIWIFGIPITRRRHNKKKSLDADDFKDKEKADEIQKDQQEMQKYSQPRMQKEKTAQENKLEINKRETDKTNTNIPEEASEEEHQSQEDSNSVFDQIHKFFIACGNFWKRFLKFFQNMKHRWKHTWLSVQKLKKQYKRLMDIWENPYTRRAADFLWKQLCHTAKRIRPNVIKGRFHMGCSDPALTGQLLGVLSIVYAFYGDTIVVEPDFEQAVFDGEWDIRGRIQIFSLLWTAWNVYRNPDVRYMRKQLYHKKMSVNS